MTTGSFGNWASGTPEDIFTEDINYGTYFVMPSAGSVGSISIFGGNNKFSDMWLQGAIYEYAPGSELKGTTGSIYIEDTDYLWRELVFATPLGLPAGSYVLTGNEKATGGFTGYQSAATNRSAADADTFPISDTSWAGGAGDFTDDYLWSMYATYEQASAEYNETYTETITLTDSDSYNWTLSREYEETINLTDTYSRVFNSISVLAETLTLTDSLIRGKIFSEILTLTDGDTFIPGIVLEETLNLTDTYSKVLSAIREYSENLTLTAKFNANYEIDLSETIILTDGDSYESGIVLEETLSLISSVTKEKTVTELTPVVTKVEIGNVDYPDFVQANVQRNMGNYSATSNFEIIFPNYAGKYSDTFSLNDDVIIYADMTTGTPTTKIFRGIVEKITYKGKEVKETIRLIGRDYGAILQDILVSPRVYKNTETSQIVKSLLIQNILGGQITWTDINSTDTTIDRITFNNISVFDALQKLAELSGYYFYVDEDKNLHFTELDSVSSGFTFSINNIMDATFKTDDSQIFNKVTVYGDRQLTGAQEVFGAQAGSAYTLDDNPSNTVVTGSGATTVLLQPGGILNVNSPSDEDVKWLVDYQSKKVILTSGTTAGDNTGWAGSSVIVDYQRSSPLISIRQDMTSQASYGKKDKVIIDRNIQSIEESNAKADAYLSDHKDPVIQGNITIRGTLKVDPGNTCVVNLPYHNVDSQTYKILNAKYNFTPSSNLQNNVLNLTVNKKVNDLTDTTKDILLRLKNLEGAEVDTSITDVQTATGSVNVETSYSVISRSIGSSFYFNIPNHNILNSPSSLLGDMRAGSTVMTS